MLCGAAALFFVAAMPVSLHAQALAGRVGPNGKTFRDGRILIIPKAGRDGALAQRHGNERARVRRHFRALGNIQVIELPPGTDVSAALARYRASGEVISADPVAWFFPAATPNDPSYADGTLWQLNNTGQNGGSNDADIDAPEAWNTLNSASNIIVAVVDTGVRITHEDLVANLWTNPGEIPGNGIDDDGNGIIDDVHGFNAVAGNNNLVDEPAHGTHVAGIIGAAGNNGVGVCGVAWKVQLMPCKFITPGSGSEDDLIECLEYALTNGAKVINCSFVSTVPFSSALFTAFSKLRDAGVLVAAAAGNADTDNDVTPYYPGNLGLDNIVCVTATTRYDGQRFNFGAQTVHLGAPGVNILSTWGAGDNSYYELSGTSMATPMVAGAMALLRVRFPSATHQQLIARLLATVDPLPSLAGRCTSGGRLNLARALGPRPQLMVLSPGPALFALRITAEPGSSCVIQTSTNLPNWSPLITNTIPASGILNYTNSSPGSSSKHFYRVGLQ